MDEWLVYVKNAVLDFSFSQARYSNGMVETTEFGIENCLTSPSLGWKNFISLKDENDKPINT